MKKNIIFIMLALLLVSIKSQAQVSDLFEEIQYKNGYVSFAKIKKEKLQKAKTEKETILKELIGNKGDISSEKTIMDIPSQSNLKIQQEKYQLYKNGIKLRGAEYIINVVNDTVSFIHGFFAPVSEESFTFSAKNCSELALKNFNTLHGINDPTNESAGIVEVITQIYYYDNSAEKFRAAWQVQVTSKNTAFSENIYISASTGEFMGAENLICNSNFTGSAQTQYSGTRNIVTDAPTSAGPFRLQETRNSVQIRTRNLNHRNDLSNITEFTDNDNNWTTAEHGNDRTAHDAHWGAEIVFDYWLNVHNRNSINGSSTNPLNIESYLHWDVPTDPDDFNARWYQNAMWYGDGFFGTNPLTSLDICAHEFGHGIDQFTGDLLYEHESGALDEGFADIWGASVEAWADPTKNRWLIGEEVLGGPIRNMANPNAFGQPDTYLGTNWVNQTGCSPNYTNDYCGVHTNSGVLNFWYFLLSQGGTGTNDIGNAYNVTGLGISTAEEIAYAAKLLMNNSNANYSLCRSLSIQAATTLFGANSCQTISVTNAWHAVGIGNQFQYSNVTISGNAIVCSSNAYSLTNLPSGSTVVWSLSPHPGAIQLLNNTPSTNQCLVSNPYKYPAVMTLTATITLSCGTVVLTKTIESDTNTTYQAGSYYQQACAAYNHSFPSQSGTLNGSPVFLYPGCMTEVSLSQMTGRTVSFVSGSPQPLSWNYSSSNSKLYLQLPTQSGPYIFSITGAGACNTKTLVFFAYSGYSLLLSPNPTSGETTVTIEQTLNEDETLKSATTETGFDYDTEWEMEVYSPSQNLKEKQTKLKGESTKIQTSGWQEGVYVVRVKYKDEILTDKLVVKK